MTTPSNDAPKGLWAKLVELPDAHPVKFTVACIVACQLFWTMALLCYFPGTIDFEEQTLGALPHDIRDGIVAPLRAYLVQPWEGGDVPFGLMAVPFFSALGHSMYALKLTAVTWAAFGMWPWIDIARRVGGPRAAWAMLLSILLPFPFFLQMILRVHTPTHMGTVVLSGLSLWFLYRSLGDESLPRQRAAFASGLVAGIGCAWAFSLWPLGLGIIGTAVVLRARRRDWLAAGAGLLPGFALLFSALLVPIFSKHEKGFWGAIYTWSWPEMISNQPRSEDSLPFHLWRLMTVHFPRLAGFTESSDLAHQVELHPSWLYFALFLGCFGLLVGLTVHGRKRDALPTWSRPWIALCLPGLSYFLVYLSSKLYTVELGGPDQFRYFLPMIPFGFLTVALGIPALRELGPRGVHGYRGAMGFLAVMGILSAINVMDLSVFPTPYRYLKGYDLNARTLSTDPGRTALNGLTVPGRRDYAELAWSYGIAHGQDRHEDLHKLLHEDYWEGRGALYRMEVDEELGTQVEALTLGDSDREPSVGFPEEHKLLLVDRFQNGPPLLRAAFLRGFTRGSTHMGPLSEIDTTQLFETLLTEVDRPDAVELVREALHRGQGEIRASQILFGGLAPGEGMPDGFSGAYVEGLAVGFAREMLTDRPWPESQRIPLPPDEIEEARTPFREWVEQERQRLEIVSAEFATEPPMRSDEPEEGSTRDEEAPPTTPEDQPDPEDPEPPSEQP